MWMRTSAKLLLIWTICAMMCLTLAACTGEGDESVPQPDSPPAANQGDGGVPDAADGALEEAYLSGVLTDERLEESVRRVLALKVKYGLSDDPVGFVDVEALNEQAKRVLGE